MSAPPLATHRFHDAWADLRSVVLQRPEFMELWGGAAQFAETPSWPTHADYTAFLRGTVPADALTTAEISCQPPRGRHVRGTTPWGEMVTAQGVVTLKSGQWHDMFNLLTWGLFPRSKLAICDRATTSRREAIAANDPIRGGRTKEEQALALFEEAGVILVTGGEQGTDFRHDISAWIDSRGCQPILYGHALFESLLYGKEDITAAGVIVSINASTWETIRIGAAAATGAMLIDAPLSALIRTGLFTEAGRVHRCGVSLKEVVAQRRRGGGGGGRSSSDRLL